MATYQVRAWGDNYSYTVDAADSTAAKKIVCRMLGRNYPRR